MDQDELLKLKEKIDTAKSEISELKGRKGYLQKQLKENHGCKSLKEARKKLKALRDEIEKLDADIEQRTKKIEEVL